VFPNTGAVLVSKIIWREYSGGFNLPASPNLSNFMGLDDRA
jgi:hypothetical protein